VRSGDDEHENRSGSGLGMAGGLVPGSSGSRYLRGGDCLFANLSRGNFNVWEEAVDARSSAMVALRVDGLKPQAWKPPRWR